MEKYQKELEKLNKEFYSVLDKHQLMYPTVFNKYLKTVIYTITCKDKNIVGIYVGHTTNENRRKIEHKSHCNNKNYKSYNCKFYRFIRDNGGWENFIMTVVEVFPCLNKQEATKRERYWIETLEANLNDAIPTRTKKEYNVDKADFIKQIKKEYE